MNCMRCGKETAEKAIFCPECLEEMERYPVKPGTLIHIPARPESEVKKTQKKKRDIPVEEQLAHAQQMIQALFVTVLCLMGALVISGILLVLSFSNNIEPPEETQPPKTRNYTIVDPAED